MRERGGSASRVWRIRHRYVATVPSPTYHFADPHSMQAWFTNHPPIFTVHRRHQTRRYRPLREPLLQPQLLRREMDRRRESKDGDIREEGCEEGRGVDV